MLNFKQPIAKISNSISNLKLPNKDIVANCDVEGAEFNILQGMKQTIEEFKPAILIEVHTEMLPDFGFTASDVVDLLEDAGYEIEPVDRDEVTFNQGNITLYCQ